MSVRYGCHEGRGCECCQWEAAQDMYRQQRKGAENEISQLQTQLSQCKREGDRYREALEWVNENSRQTAVRVMVQIALEDTDIGVNDE